MKGMEEIVAIRRHGKKPNCVFVSLVPAIDHEGDPISDSGNVQLDIAPHDKLSDIDFRPLHGLVVIMCNATDNETRYSRLAKLIAHVEPAKLVMPIQRGDGATTMHTLSGGETSSVTL